jgi:type I restriction enzyme R subunit
MTPEAKARQQIDQRLAQAGWIIQDLKELDLSAGLGIAVREYPTDTGPADYVLFVDRQACGVIEAKKDTAGENLTQVEFQTERYATANLKWRTDQAPLRFLFEATGQVIRFTDNADPAPRSRELFHFFQPGQLAQWRAQPDSLRQRLAASMPALPEDNLRDCQVSAVNGLEKSLARNKPRALIHMATGAGKTFTAITAVYRLLKFGGVKRILFLVDTRNLGRQAHQEFMAYTPRSSTTCSGWHPAALTRMRRCASAPSSACTPSSRANPSTSRPKTSRSTRWGKAPGRPSWCATTRPFPSKPSTSSSSTSATAASTTCGSRCWTTSTPSSSA